MIWDDMTQKERSSLVEAQDALKYEAITRTEGHTDWKYDDVSKHMKTRAFMDGSSVFTYKGRDMLLFEPPGLMPDSNKWGQPVEFLYDKTDYTYMTDEERVERGLAPKTRLSLVKND